MASTEHFSSSNAPVEHFLDCQKGWIKKEMDTLVETLFTQLKARISKLGTTEICQMDLNTNSLGEFNSVASPALPQSQELLSDFTAQNNLISAFGNDSLQNLFLQITPIHKNDNDSRLVKKEFVEENSILSNIHSDLFESASDIAKSEYTTSESLVEHTSNFSSNDETSNPEDDFHVDLDSKFGCDCNSCKILDVKKEEMCDINIESDYIDGCNFEFIDESTLRPVKRIKIDEDGNHEGNEDSVDQANGEDSQLNQIMVTLRLKCLLDSCPDMFETKTAFDQHMMDAHSILPNRCVVSNCHQSFHTEEMLWNHIRNDHGRITEWNCTKCDKKYSKHSQLSLHFAFYHVGGLFRCAHPHCSFVGEFRKDVYRHQEQHQKFVCQKTGCGKSFKQSHHLKAHERIHLGIKPYRCKWTGCGYASEDRSNTIRHIRGKHLNLPQTLKEQMARHIEDSRDPKDYLEVVNELLNYQ